MGDWIPLPADASPAAELFALFLFAVMFLRVCRYFLRMFGLGA